MFSGDPLKAKWTEIKGEMKKKWSEITEEELERTGGNFKQMMTLLQQKLNMKKDDAYEHLIEIADRWRKRLERPGFKK